MPCYSATYFIMLIPLCVLVLDCAFAFVSNPSPFLCVCVWTHLYIQVRLRPFVCAAGSRVYCLCVCRSRNDLIHILQAAAAAALKSLSSLTSCSTIKTQQPASSFTKQLPLQHSASSDCLRILNANL